MALNLSACSLLMIWKKKSDLAWERGYQAALTYYKQYGNLDVPTTYKTESGYRLGGWIVDQREKGDKMISKRKAQLDALGMIWKKEDPWEVRFVLAKAYYEEHGDLKIPLDYKPNGIWLNKWINEQKQIYRGNRKGKKLTENQIKRLEAIGIDWQCRSNRSELAVTLAGGKRVAV